MLQWLGRKEEYILTNASKHDLFPSTGFLIPNLTVIIAMEQEKKLLVSDTLERESLKSSFTGEGSEDDLNTLEIHYNRVWALE